MATIFPRDPFDVEESGTRFHDSLRGILGIGVDEDAVIDELVTMVNAQRLEVKAHFVNAYGEELHDEFRTHLSAHLEDTCRSLIDPLPLFDAKELRKAFFCIGSNDCTLIEIICARQPDELEAIKEAYEQEYDQSLIDRIKLETSINFERLLVAQLSGERDTSTTIDEDLAAEDAQKMYDAGEGMWGTDESEFIRLLSIRSYNQLRRTFVLYEDLASKSIQDTIEDEMILALRKGCISLVEYIKNPVNYFAMRLYDSMRGILTNEDTLRRIIVVRSEFDLFHIKQRFEEKYEDSLRDFIERELHFDFKKIMLRMIGED